MNEDTPTQEKTQPEQSTGKAPYQDALEALLKKENELACLSHNLRIRLREYTVTECEAWGAQDEEAIRQTEARRDEVQKIRRLVEAMAKGADPIKIRLLVEAMAKVAPEE